MNAIAELLIDLAKREVGNREVGGNNIGPAVVKYQSATWMKPGAWPWCAAFQSWLQRELLKYPEAQQYFGITAMQADSWRCKEVGVDAWISWAIAKKFQVLPNTVLALPGDLVIFDFQQDHKNDHIGLAVCGQLKIDSPLITIEGNVGLTDVSDANTGDGVPLKIRRNPIISKYIRMFG